MSFIADVDKDWELYDYIIGDYYTEPDMFEGIYSKGEYGLSISMNRYYYLDALDKMSPLKLSSMDSESNSWTKWVTFPGNLLKRTKSEYGNNYYSGIAAVVDVHRCLLPNEIVIESDYPTYEENYEAAKIIGLIIEDKGFIPHYYYSGNKSIHIHVFLDWDCFNKVDDILLSKLSVKYRKSLLRFKKAFMIWLRTKMINCWDTNTKEFDEDLIKASHLIRSELSKNKKGFKTFLGYNHKDLSIVPYICNENNRIYPRLGNIRLSSPKCIVELVEEFLEYLENKNKEYRKNKLNKSLSNWFTIESNIKLRECVKSILTDDFKKMEDGCKRGMFILLNELKLVYGVPQAKIIALEWNNRMGSPIQEHEIEYRLKKKPYTLSCQYIHAFLKSLGINKSKCKND